MAIHNVKTVSLTPAALGTGLLAAALATHSAPPYELVVVSGPAPGMPGANTVAAGTGAAAAPAATAKATPSSAELATDDLKQTAQTYLNALGYDPGNTTGEMTTATIIAISQFQAEKGLAVTGEVTPQLVGILAAEVDRVGSGSGRRTSD